MVQNGLDEERYYSDRLFISFVAGYGERRQESEENVFDDYESARSLALCVHFAGGMQIFSKSEERSDARGVLLGVVSDSP